MFHFATCADRLSHMQYLLQGLFGAFFFFPFLTIHFTGLFQEMPVSTPERCYIKTKYT